VSVNARFPNRSVRDSPIARSACVAALNLPISVTNPCGIPIQTSKLGIDAGSDGALNITKRVVKQYLVISNVNADRRRGLRSP